MMKKQSEGLSKNLASSRNWFRSELLPDSIRVERHQVAQATRIQYHDGVKLLFVEEGSGTLVANGISYPLRPGSCCMLYCYHFHRIIPDPGCVMQISACFASYNTFLFAAIVPGYHLTEMETSETPIHVVLSESQQERIKQILSAMEETEHKNDPLQHALFFEWLGRLCRSFSQKNKARV